MKTIIIAISMDDFHQHIAEKKLDLVKDEIYLSVDPHNAVRTASVWIAKGIDVEILSTGMARKILHIPKKLKA